MFVSNKWMGALAFAALLCAPVAGQSQKPYVNTQYKFTVTPPVGWAINNPADVVVVFIEPITNDSTVSHGKETNKEFLERINKQYGQKSASQGFRANVTITTATAPPGVTTVADYAKLTRSKAASLKLKMYKILSEKPQKLGGMPAIERNIQVTTPERTTVRTREIICLRNGQVFVVTFASSPATLSKFNPIFDKVLSSFVWK
jgi:hypothetical protein